ncbi:hypothetical protein KUTeg_004080 [Tegillarca granosa]|uniref:WSC domain-containing protein n=1 Tax=Tegillarca granosa TaxID=220873 RepID=A0ABQ9FNY1_TEGGR|nr:hypothetical protein KUTeg_004080 [Tegillarca granosa]
MAGLKFVISVTALLVSDTSAGYVYSKKQANWKTAKHSCESGDGILLGQTPILDDFVNKLPVWLDGVVTWLPWMANAGCYRYVERYIEIRSFYTLRENSPLSCLGKCNHRLPIGLLNATCYCLTTFPKLKKVSGSFCQTPCSGNTNEMCGGSGKLGFHEYITIHNGGIDETRKMDVGNNSCLTVEVSGKVYKYRDRKCTAMYPVLCQDSRICSKSNFSGNFIERMERKQWQDASIECKTYNLELADIQTIEMNVFMKNEEFWTGYFRKSNAVWNTDIFKDTTVFSTAKTSSIQAVTIPLAHTKNEETVNCAEI